MARHNGKPDSYDVEEAHRKLRGQYDRGLAWLTKSGKNKIYIAPSLGERAARIRRAMPNHVIGDFWNTTPLDVFARRVSEALKTIRA